RDKVSCQRRSVTVDFGITAVDDLTDDQVMSFDVVPAFALDDHYEIPDTATTSGWTETDPRVHADKALAAQRAYANEWKGLVRMMKKWNREQNKPITPGFLIEVMALEVLYPPFGGDYRRELQAFFASLADRIYDTWPDPAGLGPAVSDSMDLQKCAEARTALRGAEEQAALAIRMEREGRNGEALKVWRALFGPLFPLCS
ncbi:MAG TPA: CBASS oligonucleotide cyclase, partial [Chloroflexota bacterium]